MASASAFTALISNFNGGLSSSSSSQKLSLKPNSFGMRAPSHPGHLKLVDKHRCIRVFALSGAGKKDYNKNDLVVFFCQMLYFYEMVRKVDMALQDKVEKQLAIDEFDGYCVGRLVKVTVNGNQQLIRTEITDAAKELSSEKLSLLVTEAYKDGLEKRLQAIEARMNAIARSSGMAPSNK